MPALPNARHERFAQGVAAGLTADEAYVKAGYKPNRGNASRMKSDESILARIDEIKEVGTLRAEVSVERVLTELARIGFSDIRKVFTETGALKPVHEWDDDTAASIASVEVVTRPGADVDEDGNRSVEYVHKIKAWDKNSALEKLGKNLKMFIERHAHENPDGSPMKFTFRLDNASGSDG